MPPCAFDALVGRTHAAKPPCPAPPIRLKPTVPARSSCTGPTPWKTRDNSTSWVQSILVEDVEAPVGLAARRPQRGVRQVVTPWSVDDLDVTDNATLEDTCCLNSSGNGRRRQLHVDQDVQLPLDGPVRQPSRHKLRGDLGRHGPALWGSALEPWNSIARGGAQLRRHRHRRHRHATWTWDCVDL